MSGIITVKHGKKNIEVFECEDGGVGGGVFYHIRKSWKTTPGFILLHEKAKELAQQVEELLKEYESLLKIEEEKLVATLRTQEDIENLEWKFSRTIPTV